MIPVNVTYQSRFESLEVVNRGSETKLDVIGNVNAYFRVSGVKLPN